MTQVFISYSRRDLAFVEGLAADLQAAGLDVWYDLSGLEGGSRWSREIEKAIRESQYVLVVLSPDSVASKWVEEEFLYASELGKKIIPLFYKPCALPFGYRTLHFIDVQGSKYKQKFGEILRALDVKPIVQKESPAPLPEKSPSVKPEVKIDKSPKHKPNKVKSKLNPRLIIGLFGLTVIVFAGIFGFPYLGGMFSTKPEATATATWTARPLNATEAAFISKVAPTQAPQTATVSVLLTKIAGGITQIASEDQLPTEITDDLDIGSSWTRPADGMVMMYVPVGEFIMGSNVGADDEQPAHQVYLNAYWIDQTEVTNTMYAKCVSDGVCKNPGTSVRSSKYDDHPVSSVNWDDAQSYCLWADVRLPTEAEWEKAARGTDGRVFPWGDEKDNSKFNYNGTWTVKTVSVGSFLDGASPYSAFDMLGNVGEWVADFYSADYYLTSPYANPSGPSSGNDHVLRDWSQSNFSTFSRSTFSAYYDNVSYRLATVGFRCAKDVIP